MISIAFSILFLFIGLVVGMFIMAFIVIRNPLLLSQFIKDDIGKDIVEGMFKENGRNK